MYKSNISDWVPTGLVHLSPLAQTCVAHTPSTSSRSNSCVFSERLTVFSRLISERARLQMRHKKKDKNCVSVCISSNPVISHTAISDRKRSVSEETAALC